LAFQICIKNICSLSGSGVIELSVHKKTNVYRALNIIFQLFLHIVTINGAVPGLQGADGVDFGDVDDAAKALERLAAALAHLAVAADDNLLAAKHHIC
jgi:hypothetical protein